MSIADDIAQFKRIKLTWRELGRWAIVSALVLVLLYGLGRPELARPILVVLPVLVITISIKWKLRKYVWFWAVMAAIAAAHGLLIWSISWPDEWIPAALLIPFGVADFYAMLFVISVFSKLFGHSERSSKGADRAGHDAHDTPSWTGRFPQ